MTKTNVAKNAVKLVVQFGTGMILHAIVKNNLEDYDTNPAQQTAVLVAEFAIGGVVAEAASAYTDKFIDELTAPYIKEKPATSTY